MILFGEVLKVKKKSSWFSYDDVRTSGKPIFDKLPKGYISKTTCKQLGMPVKLGEESVGFALNPNRGKFYEVYDRSDNNIWDKPFYTDYRQVPDGYVMRSEVTIIKKKRPPFKPLKENEEPVAVLQNGTTYELLYNRKYEKSRQKKTTQIMKWKLQDEQKRFEEELRKNPKVVMFPKKR